jgi:hypothetical protein
MELSRPEESLVQAVRQLPPNARQELTSLAIRLAELAHGKAIDWSDVWSDEDLEDFTRASLQRFEDEESA